MTHAPIRVLVNDASAQFGALFAESAARLGWECQQASSYAVFRESVTAQDFDLVCLLLVHPEIDGLAALQELADAEFAGKVLMFNQSQALYSRAAKNLARALRFDLRNYRWPQNSAEIDAICREFISVSGEDRTSATV